MFALSSFVQNIVWNTWGPIAQSAKEVFGWSDGQIGMLPNFANIAYIVTAFPASYFMDEKGLRISVLVGNGLVLAGAGVRCFTSVPEYATWLMNLGAIFNGIAGTVFFAGPALLASIWFPPGQRTTATAISSFVGNVGFAATFILGPQLVSSPLYNTTVQHNAALAIFDGVTTQPSNTSHNITVLLNFEQLKNDIMRLMYYECGIAGVLFIATVIYFPSKPPTAPSYTASLNRIEYTKALSKIIRNGPLWLVAMANAIPAGIYGVWGSELDIILDPVGIGQIEVGWIGFYAIIAGCIASLCVARFADIFAKHMKLFLIVLYVLGGASFVWFTLLCNNVLEFSTDQLYVSCILGGLFLNACLPLFYELCCETSYPMGEGITGAFQTIINNVSGVIFLFTLQIPHIGTAWMNWALLGSVGLGLVLLLVFPETYGRTNLDIARKMHTDMVVDIQVPNESDKDGQVESINSD